MYEKAQRHSLGVEDHLSKLVKYQTLVSQESEKFKDLTQSKTDSLLLYKKEQSLIKQLELCKPVVMKIIEYFSLKEKTFNKEENLENCVNLLLDSIDDCIDAEEKF